MQRKKVFEGVKVIDFSWVLTGPQATRELAEHGATVVRVESHKRIDTLRAVAPYRDGKPGIDRTAFGAMPNTNKYGISLNLNTPKGQEIARKLVRWADVVVESMTPGTMKRWGLDYEACQKMNPGIIYFSTCQMGQYGPQAEYGGYGGHAAAVSGFMSICGWPDWDPVLVYGAYIDYVAPWYLATDLIGALLYRHRTGKGMCLDQAQMESGASFLGPALLDYAVNGRVAGRMGNRDPYAAPHSVYPCRGSGRWVAVGVYIDEEWQAFCRVLGHPDWTRNPRFATLLSRKENEDELDALVAEWTRGYLAEEVMTLMQGAGVAAGVSQTTEDLLEYDPQLKHRQHFVELKHKVIGLHSYRAPAYKLSKTPAELHKAGPCLGEDNEHVYKDIVGLSDDEMAELMAAGIITTEADLPGAA